MRSCLKDSAVEHFVRALPPWKSLPRPQARPVDLSTIPPIRPPARSDNRSWTNPIPEWRDTAMPALDRELAATRTVGLEVSDWTGSGSLVDLGDGRFAVLTNWHVTMGQDPSFVASRDERVPVAGLMGEVTDTAPDEPPGSVDVALVAVDPYALSPAQMAAAIPLESFRELDSSRAVVVGFPAEGNRVLSYIDGTDPFRFDDGSINVELERGERGYAHTGGASGSLVYAPGEDGRWVPVGLYYAAAPPKGADPETAGDQWGRFQPASTIFSAVSDIEASDADGDGIPNALDPNPTRASMFDSTQTHAVLASPAFTQPQPVAPVPRFAPSGLTIPVPEKPVLVRD